MQIKLVHYERQDQGYINIKELYKLTFLNIDRSLFAFLGTLSLWSGSLISSLLLLLLSLSFKSGLLLLDNFLILLDGFGVELDGGVAATAVISVPMFGHEDSSAASGAVLLEVGYVAIV
jgi:hypothetical protein